MIFINITITISENGINYNVFQVKTRYKILTVSPRRRNSLNGDEPRRQTRQTGALVRMLANANLLPVAVLVPPVLLS